VPDLPTVEVQPRPIHAVPTEEPPIPKVTILDRNGRVVATREPPPTPPLPAPTPSPSNTPFGGQAQATGATTLAVGGKTVRLFGVRVAEPRDRCGLGSGDARNCVDVARDALAQRLRRYPNVYCRPPPDQRDNLAAICIDQTGTDLGGFLVAEGYALADIGQSYEYFGSEGIARYYRRGLWRNR
jgi:endonuclease YncB( thermonuclease family)